MEKLRKPVTCTFWLIGGTAVDVELGKFDITTLESINFSVGVDPAVNNQNPTQWSASHALAPKSPSMHWGWAAGYRFVALEGKTGSSLNTTFEIHALGNDNFFKISIPTKGAMDNGDLVVELDADYTEALSNIDISSGLVIHGETDQAVRCLRNLQTLYSVLKKETRTRCLRKLKQEIATVLFPNPSTGSFSIDVPQSVTDWCEVSVLDLTEK